MEQQTSKTQKPTIACKPHYLDFLLCQKRLGFNDLICKGYRSEYQNCIKSYNKNLKR